PAVDGLKHALFDALLVLLAAHVFPLSVVGLRSSARSLARASSRRRSTSTTSRASRRRASTSPKSLPTIPPPTNAPAPPIHDAEIAWPSTTGRATLPNR